MIKDGNTDLRNIIDRAKNGDKEAFSLIYNQYFSPVFRYTYLRVGNKSIAEDISQEVFIKIYNSLVRFDFKDNLVLPYFFTIARNTIIDYKRKTKNIEFLYEFTEDFKDNVSGIQENLFKKEELFEVLKKVVELPEDQQEAITLRFINGYSNREISIILEKKEDNVRQLQSRGLRSIREKLLQKI